MPFFHTNKSSCPDCERYKERIETLESENALLRGRMATLTDGIHDLVLRLPIAALTADRQGHIVLANAAFIKGLSYEKQELAQTHPALGGIEVKELLSEELYQIYRRGILGQDVVNQVGRWGSRSGETGGDRASVSIYTLVRGEIVLMLVREIFKPAILNEEIVQRLRSAIDQKMSMVQKIGFLLGEEVSQEVESLNTVIRMVETGPQGKQEQEETTHE